MLFLLAPTTSNGKSHIEDLLRSKGLYRIISGTEDFRTEESRKIIKWHNKNNSAHGLIGIPICLDLQFCL